MIRFSNTLRRLPYLIASRASLTSQLNPQRGSRSCTTIVNEQVTTLQSSQPHNERSNLQAPSSASSSPTSGLESSVGEIKTRSKYPVDNAPFQNYTVRDLMRARVHMGHRTKLWNPRMAPYLLGHRNGMHIIDLDKTVELLRRALTATSLMAEHDCTFLWLGPRDVQKSKIIERNAQKAGAYTIDGARWIGGTLTNPIYSNQAKRFNYRIPDCLFVIDVNRHKPALKEAQLVGIPTIAIVDSDCDPGLITYPIPGNDDNALAIYLYSSLMKYAILDGRRRGRKLNRPSYKIPDFSSDTNRSSRQSSFRR